MADHASRIQVFTSGGTYLTQFGTPGSGNGEFRNAAGVAIDAAGNVYMGDYGNHAIRKGVPFAVTTIPQSQAVLAGTSVTLGVSTSGPGTFSFQWLFAGTSLPGETNTILALGPVGRTNSGVYSVLVSNGLGNSITLNATVRALLPPLLQTPQIAGNGTVRLLFQDSDLEIGVSACSAHFG